MIKLRGTPHELDGLIRPYVRWALALLGTIATGVCLWFELWWWAPLPLGLALVGHEFFFWLRADRSIQLSMDAEQIVVADTAGSRTLAVPLKQVFAATLHVREGAAEGRSEAVVVLSDTKRIQLAVRFLVEPGFQVDPADVPARAMEELLGGYGGLLHTLAPPESMCRQTVDDPTGQAIQFLRRHLPVNAWNRTALRVWRGAEPPLSPYGRHPGPPDALLTLDGDRWTLRGDELDSQGTVTLLRCAGATRQIELIRRPDPNERIPVDALPVEDKEVPHLLLELDEDLTIALPAPRLGQEAPSSSFDEGMWHTHLPEGASALWHVLNRWPAPAWPKVIRAAGADALTSAAPHSRARRQRGHEELSLRDRRRATASRLGDMPSPPFRAPPLRDRAIR